MCDGVFSANTLHGKGKMNMNEKKLVEIIPVSAGWLKKYIFRYQLEDGNTYDYEVISRTKIETVQDAKRAATKNNAVTIVPITEDGNLIITKEYRYPVNDYIYEFPAGLIDAGEDAKTAAIRELREETGLEVVEVLEELKGGYSSAGMTNELVSIVICKVRGTIRNSNGKEEIQAKAYTLEEAFRMLSDNSKISGRLEFFLAGLKYALKRED